MARASGTAAGRERQAANDPGAGSDAAGSPAERKARAACEDCAATARAARASGRERELRSRRRAGLRAEGLQQLEKPAAAPANIASGLKGPPVKGVLMLYALRKWSGSGSSRLQGSWEFQHY